MKVCSVEYVQEHLEGILEIIQKTGKEIVITQNGKPVAIMKKYMKLLAKPSAKAKNNAEG